MNLSQNFQNMESEDLSKWNDEMILKYHKNGTIFESKNPLLRLIEKERLKKIIKLSHLNKDDVVLDLGCGEGVLISFLPEVKRVVGIDISKIALKKAEEILKNKPNIQLEWGDAQKLNLPDESFDKIICSETLEHLPQPQKTIREIYRLLKKNGLAVISVPDEKRIKLIMKIVKALRIKKMAHTMRQEEDYEWHLHSADKNFIFNLAKDLFEIKKIYRIPPIIGYHFIGVFKKR